MSQATAESIALSSWSGGRKRTPVYPYRCPTCGFWHMTKRAQSKLDYGRMKEAKRG